MNKEITPETIKRDRDRIRSALERLGAKFKEINLRDGEFCLTKIKTKGRAEVSIVVQGNGHARIKGSGGKTRGEYSTCRVINSSEIQRGIDSVVKNY